MDENQKLLDINQDLESKGIKLRIEKRGKVLNIRGSLPDKNSHDLSKVQRISLKLPYDINGLEEARKAIELVDFQLKKNQFCWSNWIKEKAISSTKTNKTVLINEIESFKKLFFSIGYYHQKIIQKYLKDDFLKLFHPQWQCPSMGL